MATTAKLLAMTLSGPARSGAGEPGAGGVPGVAPAAFLGFRRGRAARLLSGLSHLASLEVTEPRTGYVGPDPTTALAHRVAIGASVVGSRDDARAARRPRRLSPGAPPMRRAGRRCGGWGRVDGARPRSPFWFQPRPTPGGSASQTGPRPLTPLRLQLKKLEDHGSAKLEDILGDVYRAAVPDPMDITKFEWEAILRCYGCRRRGDPRRAAEDGESVAVNATPVALHFLNGRGCAAL